MNRAAANLFAFLIIVLTLLSLPRLYNLLYRMDWTPASSAAGMPVGTVAPDIVKEDEKAPRFKFYTGQSAVPKTLRRSSPPASRPAK